MACAAGLALGATLAVGGCTTNRPSMCTAAGLSDAGADLRPCTVGVCVAGRCQSDAGPPQVEQATRYVTEPIDLACIDDEDTTSGSVPASCNMGRPHGARLLMRFSIPLSDQADVVEAYVLLHRAPDHDPDPAPFSLHASRIVGEWNGQDVRAATLPAFMPTLTANTRVDRSDLIRVDVRDIVKQWRRKDPSDRGLVLESSGGHGTGMHLAIAPSPSGAARGPVLELYVK
jgi:hypothetical protein